MIGTGSSLRSANNVLSHIDCLSSEDLCPATVIAAGPLGTGGPSRPYRGVTGPGVPRVPGGGPPPGGPPARSTRCPGAPQPPQGTQRALRRRIGPGGGEGAGTPKKGPRTPSGGILGRPRKKGQKWPFLGPLRRKVQGEWGGSAHSPDPTAQSARRARDLVRARRTRLDAAGWAGLWGWLGCSACGLVLLCDWSSDWNRRKAGASHLSRWSESSPPMAHQWSICSEVPARRVRIDPHLLPARCCIRRVSSVLTMLSHRSASRRADASLCRMRRLAAHQ